MKRSVCFHVLKNKKIGKRRGFISFLAVILQRLQVKQVLKVLMVLLLFALELQQQLLL
jgi:hypothetical protein